MRWERHHLELHVPKDPNESRLTTFGLTRGIVSLKLLRNGEDRTELNRQVPQSGC